MYEEMKCTSISFPAQGGPLDEQFIEAKGIKGDDGGVFWPGGMWTVEGWYYELMFDENEQPTHFQYDGSRDKVKAGL